MKLLSRALILVAAACLATPSLAADQPAVPRCPTLAAAPTAAAVKAALPTARDRGFLWRLTKDGRISWLYGTLHVGAAGWGVPGPSVLAAYRASDVVALELDMTDAKVIAAAGALAPSKPLSPELDQRLRRVARGHCLPDAVVDALPPVTLISAMIVFEAVAEGFDPSYGADMTLAVLAHADHKRLVSLEDIQQQFAALLGAGDDASVFIASSVDQLESDEARPMLRRLVGMWGDSRFDELADYETWCRCMNTADDRALMHSLLDERNLPMADAIDRLHGAGQRVFAAVGSLHMIGAQGLPALLAARGYEVRRIGFDAVPARP